MSAEEDLPVELKKLEIAPTLPLLKSMDSSIPLELNPFYDEGIKSNVDEAPHCSKLNLKHTRRCRLRRRSESFLDDCKESNESSIDHAHTQATRSSPRIHRQPFKKTAHGIGSRKTILREPVLRGLHSSLMLEYNRRRTAQSLSEDDKCTTARNRGISDFRDLINECGTLIDQDTDLKDRHRLSKSFNTLQTAIDTKTCAKDLSKIGSCGRFSLDSIKSSLATDPSTSSSYNSTNRSNTTCSQQAGNGTSVRGNACDDVTINELASYFDTIVHIPKKMSTMAEMMYT